MGDRVQALDVGAGLSSLTDEAGAADVLAASVLLDEAAVCLPAATRRATGAEDIAEDRGVEEAARPPEEAPIRSQPLTGPGHVAVWLPLATADSEPCRSDGANGPIASTTHPCTCRKQVTA